MACLAVLSPPRSVWAGLGGGWKLLRFDAKGVPIGAIVLSVRPDIVDSVGAGTVADVEAGAVAGADRVVLGGGKAALDELFVDVALRPVLVPAGGLRGGADPASAGQPGGRWDEKGLPGGTLTGTGSVGDVCGMLGVVADTGAHW